MNFAKEDSSSIDVQKYLRRRSGSKITTENVQVHELYVVVIKYNCVRGSENSFFHKLIVFVLDVLDINMIGNGQVCNRTLHSICLKRSMKIPLRATSRFLFLNPSICLEISVLFHTFH